MESYLEVSLKGRNRGDGSKSRLYRERYNCMFSLIQTFCKCCINTSFDVNKDKTMTFLGKFCIVNSMILIKFVHVYTKNKLSFAN